MGFLVLVSSTHLAAFEVQMGTQNSQSGGLLDGNPGLPIPPPFLALSLRRHTDKQSHAGNRHQFGQFLLADRVPLEPRGSAPHVT
jgi:hypothetical protein